jgi:hypothetical protein
LLVVFVPYSFVINLLPTIHVVHLYHDISIFQRFACFSAHKSQSIVNECFKF